jgi:hypothetical protein
MTTEVTVAPGGGGAEEVDPPPHPFKNEKAITRRATAEILKRAIAMVPIPVLR